MAALSIIFGVAVGFSLGLTGAAGPFSPYRFWSMAEAFRCARQLLFHSSWWPWQRQWV